MSVEHVEEGFALAPKSDADGLIPCITTDANVGEVLTLGYMNAVRPSRPWLLCFGLMPPPLQHKLDKPTDAVDAEDLVQICKAWVFDVQTPMLVPMPQED